MLTAAGNLAGGGQHDRRTVVAGGSATFQLEVPQEPLIGTLWLNVNWRGSRYDMSWSLASPVGDLEGAATDEVEQHLIVGGVMEVLTDSSDAGTHLFAFRLEALPGLLPGSYLLTLHSTARVDLLVDAYKWDNRSGWSGASRFVDFSDEGTVTWPATAHGIIVAGAYSGREGHATPPGALNTFSGRGRALDGRRLVDLAAPGSYTFTAASSTTTGSLGAWRRFSGTSAAVPHVAGTVALLLQAEPEAHPELIEQALTDAASADADTGTVPNAAWGYGKLDAARALEMLREMRGGEDPPRVRTNVSGRVGPARP